MATNLNKVPKSIAKKLTKVEKLKRDLPVADIEDFPGGGKKSTYFSPIQTRNQRKATGNRLKQTSEVLQKRNIEKPSSSSVTQLLATVPSNSLTPKKSRQEISDEFLVKWEPPNWEKIFNNIRKMRSGTEAPVDTMGCHKCSDEDADEKTQRYHKLVALMLSSQTKDQITFEAMNRLKDNTLTPESICKIDEQTLENLLRPVSFYKNKAKYIKSTAEILVEKYASDIPNNLKELLKLPGVGPKMAHICMSTAWNKITGIGVDVHVHRISNRLGWVRRETKEPEKTRQELESWVPLNMWHEFNYLLVGFGQTICTPVRPKCDACLNKDICPFAIKAAGKKA